MIFQGQDSPNGGTSAATPLWAALLARIAGGLPVARQLRFLTPLLYGTAPNGQPVGQATCTDITSGNNDSPGVQGCTARPGYDAVSGWGTPIGTELQQLLPLHDPPAPPHAARELAADHSGLRPRSSCMLGVTSGAHDE